MYEFVKTQTGWRIFWGPDPAPAEEQENGQDGNCGQPLQEPIVLPFRRSESATMEPPAA